MYDSTVRTIELNLVQMPLGELQRPQGDSATGARDYPRFLYDDRAFSERVTARQLQRVPMHVVLQRGVPDWLVSLSGLLRPLIELHWTRAVAGFNGQDFVEDRLRDHLFGSERRNLQPLRPGLLEAQQGRCFYCEQRLPPNDGGRPFRAVVAAAERRPGQPRPRRLAVQRRSSPGVFRVLDRAQLADVLLELEAS